MAEVEGEKTSGALEESEKAINFLWDDQVEFAKALVERRKVLSATLAVIVGLGFFRIDLHRSPDEIAVVHGTMLFVVKALITASMTFFGIGGYLLFTQKSSARRTTVWCARWVYGYFRMLIRKARSETAEESEGHKMTPVTFPESNPIRSSCLMMPDTESVVGWCQFEQSEARAMRLERQLAAYRELRERNLRIAYRLRQSIGFLFVGFVMAFAAVVSYLWSSSGV